MMEDQTNNQEYYEAAYERIIEQEVPFYAMDITGLKWVEIDAIDDFSEAAQLFRVEGAVQTDMQNLVSPKPSANPSPAIGWASLKGILSSTQKDRINND